MGDYAKTRSSLTYLATIKSRNPPRRIQALDSVTNISSNFSNHHPNKRGNPYMYCKHFVLLVGLNPAKMGTTCKNLIASRYRSSKGALVWHC